jgi:hypothetical protein
VEAQLSVSKMRSLEPFRSPSANAFPIPYAALCSPGPYPPEVDVRCRELYLSDVEFQRFFHCTKGGWRAIPGWKQRHIKQSLGLF